MTEPHEPGGTSNGAARRGLRHELLGATLVVVATAGYVVAGRVRHAVATAPTLGECHRLVDHYLVEAARQRSPEVDDASVARALASARISPEHVDDVDRCRRGLSAAQVRCGLAAPNADDIERCLQ